MTTHMVRKQIYISRRQQVLLKRLAEQRGLSEAEIIRQAIDREAVNAIEQPPASDRSAWEEVLEFMRSRREHAHQFSEPYRWNREELYEERLKRYGPKSEQPKPSTNSIGPEGNS